MNRVTLGGLACGLALLVSACSSTGGKLSANGPFGTGGPNSGTICAWTRPGGVVHDSFDEFPNTGGTATIDKVALVDPRHLRLVTAWVVPTTARSATQDRVTRPRRVTRRAFGGDSGNGFRARSYGTHADKM